MTKRNSNKKDKAFQTEVWHPKPMPHPMETGEWLPEPNWEDEEELASYADVHGIPNYVLGLDDFGNLLNTTPVW